MILMIDNYDSFTYNLVQYLEELGEEVQVVKNDAVSIGDIYKLSPDAIVISPGPSSPREAGISIEAVQVFAGKLPILGVCLGHQSIACAFGGRVAVNYRLMHGKISSIYHDEKTIFTGIDNPFAATRYHSLIVEKKFLPSCLEISALSEEGEIMALRHKYWPVEGVQFHPESIMTAEGKKLLNNFLTLKERWRREVILGR